MQRGNNEKAKMKVMELFNGWFRPNKGAEKAAFFAAVGDRDVVENSLEHGVVFGGGMRESVPLTVHTVKFSGEPVPRVEAPEKWCLFMEGNTLQFTS
jgi:hypothetical protein